MKVLIVAIGYDVIRKLYACLNDSDYVIMSFSYRSKKPIQNLVIQYE